MTNSSDATWRCLDDEVEYSALVFAIFVINLVCLGCAVVFYCVGIGYVICGRGFRNRFKLFQIQGSYSPQVLQQNEADMILSYMVSACWPFVIDQDAFVPLCKTIGALQVFSLLAAFSWTLLLTLHLCHVAALECQLQLAKDENDPSSESHERPTLDEAALQKKVSNMSNEGFHRKISRDLLALWKKNVHPVYERDVEGVEQEQRRRLRSVWYAQLFGQVKPSLPISFFFGYVPPAVLALLGFVTIPEIFFPEDFQTNDKWEDVEGLDVFCWAGPQSNLMWYIFAYLPLLLMGTYYLRLKAVQMVRILHLGPSYVSTTPGESALRGVSAWQRRRGSHGNDEDYRKESSPSSVVKSFYLSPTAVQMLVMILAIIIGFLQVFYVWGLMIPYATLAVLKGFVFLQHNVLVHTECQKKWFHFSSARENESQTD